MDGILIVDKPKGMTSFDVVREVRKKYNTKKVGHIGTLDPLATGVLTILIGKATKLSDFLMEHEKEYIATLKLGKSTDTGDSEGNTIEEKEVKHEIYEEELNNYSYKEISKREENSEIYIKLEEVFQSFIGESMQIPPMYSAIKVQGKKLYELAREGKTVERTPRKIFIKDITILKVDTSNNEIEYKVTCSKGTYIRVLCEDIAKKLGTVGYMKSLRRTRIGNFRIEDAGKFIEIENILTDIPKIEIQDYEKLLNGIKIPIRSDVIKCKRNDDQSQNTPGEYNNSEKIQIKDSVANDYDGLVNIYHENKYVGIGEIKNKVLKRKIIL